MDVSAEVGTLEACRSQQTFDVLLSDSTEAEEVLTGLAVSAIMASALPEVRYIWKPDRVARMFWYVIPKMEKMYPINTKCIQWS
jgi:hypothetical protein